MSQLFETPADPAIAGFAQVALEQGLDASASGWTYAIPKELADLAVGSRVIVPLGRANKPTAGYIVELTKNSELDPSRVKRIISRDPQSVALPPDLIELARWMSGYYCCPLGMVFPSMLPAAVKRGTGTVTETLAGLSSEAPDVKVTALQQKVLDALRDSGEPWVEVRRLADLAGARTMGPVNQLIEKKVLTTTQSTTVQARTEDEWDDGSDPASSVTLNGSQQRAFDRIAAKISDGFSVNLLHGVTGSGKTEVYLRVIEHMLSKHPDRGAIVLVPEIALTPQTVRRFISRLAGVAVLHSGQTDAQRNEQWRRISSGKANIVVGARSAVFAPLKNLGVIIVDEEHEYSYKQDQLPRYHARDVAVKRGQMLGIPIVLGSATPSLESYYNAVVKKSYHLLQIPERVSGLKMPQVRIVDMRDERRKRVEYSGKGGVHLLSVVLENQLRQTLKDGGQALLLLNRRGYANYIACPDQRCGWMMECSFCDATMVYHRDAALPAGGNVRCHHCDAEQLLPANCPTCGRRVTVFGLGTQRVEEELDRKFPGLSYLRMDSDAMRTGRDYRESLDKFRRGEVQALVGTQMIAKGLDFPNVRLVGVISGDTSLHMPDFRASERTFQLIAQVAGRAGRSEHPGLVLVQSFSPEDPAIQFAAKHDYEGFAERELKLREQVGLPPVSRMARVVVRDRDFAKCFQHAQKLMLEFTRMNKQLGDKVRLRGPMPCPIARVAEFHRQQIELIAPAPGAASALQELFTAMRNAKLVVSDARTAVDVDPVDLL